MATATEVISFNSAISACEKGGQWLRALNVLRCGLPFAFLRPSDPGLHCEGEILQAASYQNERTSIATRMALLKTRNSPNTTAQCKLSKAFMSSFGVFAPSRRVTVDKDSLPVLNELRVLPSAISSQVPLSLRSSASTLLSVHVKFVDAGRRLSNCLT